MDMNYYNFNFLPKNFLKGLSLSTIDPTAFFDTQYLRKYYHKSYIGVIGDTIKRKL